MALLFDADTKYADFVASVLDQVSAITVVALYYPTTTASDAYVLFDKASGSSGTSMSLYRPKFGVGNNDWRFERKRATTNTFLESAGDILAANRWEWLGVLEDTNSAPQFFHGTLSTVPVEPTYGTRTTGAGAADDDSGTTLRLGRSVTNSNQMIRSRVGFLGIADRRMSAAELLSHWPAPRIAPGAGWVLFTYPGFHGGANAVDLSGQGVNGTVNGSPSLVNGPPLPLSSVIF